LSRDQSRSARCVARLRGLVERPAYVFEQLIQIAHAQGGKHALVLLLHQAADEGLHVGPSHVLGVLRAGGLDDATPIGEQMGDDARVPDAGVFRLDVEDAPPVPDVIVEPEEWGGHVGHNQTLHDNCIGYHARAAAWTLLTRV